MHLVHAPSNHAHVKGVAHMNARSIRDITPSDRNTSSP